MSLDDLVSIPELPLEMEISTSEESADILKDESKGARVYAFLGTGQGGGRLAEAFYKLGYKKTLVCNTAPQDLNSINLPEDQKILFDAGQAGAGKSMRLGEEAAAKGQQRLYETLLRKIGKVDHIFICVGSGGGSGGGSALVLREAAIKFMIYNGAENPETKVGVIMSLPTTGECASPNVAQNSHFLAEHLCTMAQKGLLSPLILVDNDKIQKLYPKLTVKQFWPTVNDTVAGLFHIFNIIPTKNTNFVTFDAADYATLMQAAGVMCMGITSIKEWKNSEAISNAINSNLEKTLLADGIDLRTATHAAAVVLGGSNIFEEAPGLMSSVDGAFDTLAVITGNALIHRGIYEDNRDRLAVYTLVGGLKTPQKRLDALKRFQNAGIQGEEKTQMPAPKFQSRLYNE